MGSHVKLDYALTIVQHSPMAHILGSCALMSLVAYFLLFGPIVLCNGIPPSPVDKTPECRNTVQQNTGTKQKWLREIELTTYAPGFSTLSYLSLIFPPLRHPSNLTPTYPVLDLHLRHQQPSNHTGLIHSLHVSKPSQYSMFHSTIL